MSMFGYRLRRWHVVMAALLIVTLLAGTAPASAAALSTPAMPAQSPASSMALLPQGNGVTPLTQIELQAVDGEGIQLLVIGAKAALRCARSSVCRKAAAKVAFRIARGVTEAVGAYKLWFD